MFQNGDNMNIEAKKAIQKTMDEYRQFQVFYNALNKTTVYKSVPVSKVINWLHLLLDYDKVVNKAKPIEVVSIRTFTAMCGLRKYVNYLKTEFPEDMSRLKKFHNNSMLDPTELKAFNIVYEKLIGVTDSYNLRGLLISLLYTFEKNASPLWHSIYGEKEVYKNSDQLYLELLLRYKPELRDKIITMHTEIHNLKDV